jgi:hypothetical protein
MILGVTAERISKRVLYCISTVVRLVRRNSPLGSMLHSAHERAEAPQQRPAKRERNTCDGIKRVPPYVTVLGEKVTSSQAGLLAIIA